MRAQASRQRSVALKAPGLDVGRHEARRRMREDGWAAGRPKKRHADPSGETARVAASLHREFDAGWPHQKGGPHRPVDGGGLGVPSRGVGLVLASGGRRVLVRCPRDPGWCWPRSCADHARYRPAVP